MTEEVIREIFFSVSTKCETRDFWAAPASFVEVLLLHCCLRVIKSFYCRIVAHVKAEEHRFVEGVAGEILGRDLDFCTAYMGTQYTNHEFHFASTWNDHFQQK
jgi:hypothetical protein